MFGESKVKQNPFQSQIHSESIKNPTKPWRIYQILHIMIPAIGFQEFTIGMLTPPNKKENFQKFRGVIIRQPTLHILNPALHCIFKCAAHRFDRSFRISTPDLFWLPKLSRREPAQYWPRGLVGKCLECSQQRRSLDTAVRCTLRHAMHKLGYGILIQFDVMYVTHNLTLALQCIFRRAPHEFRLFVLKCFDLVCQQSGVFGAAAQCTLRPATHKLGYGSLMQFDACYTYYTWVWIESVCQQSRGHWDWFPICAICANEATEISWKRIGTPIFVPARIVCEFQLG